LWDLKREALVNFYKHHYIPNNATLVLVGDVDPEDAISRVEHEFGAIEPNFEYKKEVFYHGADLKTHSVKLYRDITTPMVILSWVIPGATTKNDYLLDIASFIIGAGKGSRLYKKLVDELQLVTDLEAFAHIHHELHELAITLVTERELMRAIKQVEAEHLSLLESNQKQAYEIGKYYLATGDEKYVYTFTDYPKDALAQEVQQFIASYLRPSLMHTGSLLPLAEEERAYWLKLQEIADQEDELILSRRTREEGVEPARGAVDVVVHPPKPFSFARADLFYLDNGLNVLSHNNDT
jgi:zinc protease